MPMRGLPNVPWQAWIRGKTICILDAKGDHHRPVIAWMGFDGSSRQLRQQRAIAHLVASAPRLYALVEKLGRCGSCGGSGQYKDKGFRGEHGFVEQLVTCKKCEGRGLSLEAYGALAEARGDS
jgi:hypothetical protein